MLKFIDLHTGRETYRCGACAICLGNFDGVHIGHAELIRRTSEIRKRLLGKYEGIVGGAWCFMQPPADFLSDDPPKHLTTLDEKLERFSELGLDIAILGDFSELRDTGKAEFVNDILIGECGAKAAVCGFNFRFGRNGEGRPSDLSALPDGVETVDPVCYKGETVSSSRIRKSFLIGDTETAFAMLGHGYTIDAEVIHGKEVGRELGFPTINQKFAENKLVIPEGVYVSETYIDRRRYRSVTNVGNNPTFASDDLRCETHIIGYSGDLYGKKIKVDILAYLRGEKTFSGIEELRKQLDLDVENARKY